jgi:hypothetical protein
MLLRMMIEVHGAAAAWGVITHCDVLGNGLGDGLGIKVPCGIITSEAGYFNAAVVCGMPETTTRKRVFRR